MIIIVNAILCIALLMLCSKSNLAGRMSLLSPVALVSWFGLLFLILPTIAIYSGFETKWYFMMDEKAVIERSQFPYTAFILSAFTAMLITRSLMSRYRAVTIVAHTNMTLASGYLFVAMMAFMLMLASGAINATFSGGYENVNRLDLKYLLSFVDLAIPAIALIAFSRVKTSFWLMVLLMMVCLGYIMLGSRYRIAILMILVVFYFLGSNRSVINVKSIVIAALGVILLAIVSVGRSYRKGFDLQTVTTSSLDSFTKGLASDVNIHLTMGAVLEFVPRHHGFDFFAPIYVAVTSIIPRAIWIDKPAPEYLLAIPGALVPYGLQFSGAALPLYGEWYLMGGYPAILAISILVLSILENLYSKAVNDGKYAIAASLACFSAYAYTRGYMAQNVLAFIFIVVPAYLGYKRFGVR